MTRSQDGSTTAVAPPYAVTQRVGAASPLPVTSPPRWTGDFHDLV